MEETSEQNNDQIIARKMYLAILVSFGLTLVPTMSMAIVSTIFLTGLLIAAYVIRNKVDDGGLAHHHMGYIIRTAWIGGVYAMILTMFSSLYMIPNIDYSAIEPCAQSIASAGMGGSEAEIVRMVQPCLDRVIKDNKQVFIVATAMTAVPLLLFFFVRFGRGFMKARQGQMVKNPLSWW